MLRGLLSIVESPSPRRHLTSPLPELACLKGMQCYNLRPSIGGAVAQLGERLVRNEKVRSSILLGSTNSD